MLCSHEQIFENRALDQHRTFWHISIFEKGRYIDVADCRHVFRDSKTLDEFQYGIGILIGGCLENAHAPQLKPRADANKLISLSCSIVRMKRLGDRVQPKRFIQVNAIDPLKLI